MKITKNQLRRIIKEEILKEKVTSDENTNKITITGNIRIFDIYLLLDIFIVLYIL